MRLFYPILVIVLSLSGAQSEWSDSGAWSACSRTCGGGITYQERTCIGGNCEGPSKTYRSCNIQDCPNGNRNFRKEQCAEYNSVPFRNQTYQWVPYSGALDNPCSLSCMPKYEFFYNTFKEKVVDGTKCAGQAEDSFDMCVNGVCMKAGCDLILGSDAKEDKCRVCNGRGIKCRTVNGTYAKKAKGIGAYVDILEIPAGAKNIHIQENSRTFLALRTRGSFILNGNRRMKHTGKYKALGSVIDYEILARRKEKIFILGPIEEAVYLSLLLLNENINVTYEYSVNDGQEVVDHMITYSWKVGEYGACNRRCNGGTKSRDVYCVQDRDKTEVEDEKCHATPKPEEEAACNVHHCPPRWFVGAWSPCSRTCEEGTQVRRVHCEKDTPTGIQMVNEILCPGIKAITQRKCVELAECPKWKLGVWSECSKTCEGGVRTRSVQCIAIDNNLIADDRCPEHSRPRDEERCNDTPCEVRWVSGDWGDCRPSCGKGMRTRTVYCASASQVNRRYPDYICNQDNKPEVMKPCNNTEKCPPMWYASMWSKCTARCGKGIQMRNVFCGVKQTADSLLILPNRRCGVLPQLNKLQPCRIKPCYTQWIALSWQPCSSTCGESTRKRDVKCYADSEEDTTGESCDPDTKPHSEDVCNLVDCPDGSNQRIARTTKLPEQENTTPLVNVGPSAVITQRRPTRPQFKTLPPTESRAPRTTRSTTRGPTVAQRTTRPEVELRTTQAPQVTAEPIRNTAKTPGPLSTILFPTTQTGEDNDIHGMSKPAEIVRGPENMEAVVGSDIRMPCVATGNPKPDIFWLKGNLDVSVFGRRFQVLPDGTLIILQVQEVDEDQYTCVANNAISRRSQPGYLRVLTPPHVEMSLGYTVKQGEEARIQCRVSGKPRPTVQWYKDGQPLSLQRDARMSITSREIYIRSTTLEDHGTYDCKATNRNGERIAHMVLDVMPDEQTRLHDLMNGDCTDTVKVEDCAMVGKINGFCDRPYYQKVCCITCRAKNKLLTRRSEGI